MLLDWAFKAGRHQIGWAILERSLYGLAALAVRQNSGAETERLKTSIRKRLDEQPDVLEQEIRDRTARDIRETAATLYANVQSLSRIEFTMAQLDAAVLRPLLEDVANILSPDTAGEPVNINTSFLA
jgi:hypothetical protein